MNELINEDLVKLQLEGVTKEEIINELARLIDKEGRLNNLGNYLKEVLKREDQSTTGIGFGVAIPHGKTDAVRVPTVAFGRIDEGIDWRSLDDEPVKMVFLLAVPEEAESNIHLKILAALSRKLMDEDFRDKLITIEKTDQLIEILETIFTGK